MGVVSRIIACMQAKRLLKFLTPIRLVQNTMQLSELSSIGGLVILKKNFLQAIVGRKKLRAAQMK